ncbi:MAG TPA: hypothetical protein VF447_07560 [Terriglobales bacterium]
MNTRATGIKASKTITLDSRTKIGVTILTRSKIDTSTLKLVARKSRVGRSNATITLTGTARSTKSNPKLISGGVSKGGIKGMDSAESVFLTIGIARALGVGTVSTLIGI